MSKVADQAKMEKALQPQPIRIRIFGRTDVGQIREHNEDNFLVANLSTGRRGLMAEDREQEVGPQGTVMGVCDGMGGAAAGEVASQLAVDIIHEQLASKEPPADRDEFARRLVGAVEVAGARIFHEARADRSRRGMGTTATVAALIDSRLFVAQVGDSRAYILRGGRLVQVSRDQSLVNQLIEAGQLTEEEAETFEHNNIILQALGTSETVQVDLTYVDLRAGDVLLICSDGLSGMIRSDEIREVLMKHEDPLVACKELTDRANSAGGHDNITVIVTRFIEGLEEPEEADDLAYAKYALPDSQDPAESGERISTHPELLQVTLPSEEAENDSRKLRVSYTMVGVANAMVAGAVEGSAGSPPRISERPLARDAASGGPVTGPSVDEPVVLPTQGLPPRTVGAIVFTAMVLVTVLGFVLLR
jgi:PPM family protein phosphatase